MTPTAARAPDAPLTLVAHPPCLSLAGDLRLACMRISRRVRFESTTTLPRTSSRSCAGWRRRPRTPGELAEIERVAPRA